MEKLSIFEKVQFVLRIWTKVAKDIKCRDRSMKTIQYSALMLLGWYGEQYTKDTVAILTLTRYTASTCRKGFWMFKCINHLQMLVDMIDSKQHSLSNPDLGLYLIELLEQFYYILYHWWETLVYLARSRLIDPSNEKAVDVQLCQTWFISDAFSMWAACIRLGRQINKIYTRYIELTREQLQIEDCTPVPEANGVVMNGHNGHITTEVNGSSSTPIVSISTNTAVYSKPLISPYQLILRDRTLMRPLFDQSLNTVIVSQIKPL